MTEAKLNTFNMMPIGSLRVGMTLNNGISINWLTLPLSGTFTSLQAAMTATVISGAGRMAWLALANATNSMVQSNCNSEGINRREDSLTNDGWGYARIGLLGNNENDCVTPDSVVGFGLKWGPAGGYNYVQCANDLFSYGLAAGVMWCSVDYQPSFGYILGGPPLPPLVESASPLYGWAEDASTAFSYFCPGNQYITQWIGRQGNCMDSLGAICSDGTQLGPTTAVSSYGVGGHALIDTVCLSGFSSTLVWLNGNSVSGLRPTCNGTGVTSGTSGNGNMQATFSCPSGSVLSGFSGTYFAMNGYCVNKLKLYCTVLPLAIQPPPPPAPPPSPPQLPWQVTAGQSSPAVGLIAWYDFVSYNPSTATWTSKVQAANSAVFRGHPFIATDAAGTSGSSAALNYIAGNSSTSIIFPESIPASAWSVCTVSRYLAGGPNGRVFSTMGNIYAPSESTEVGWLHGHWAGLAGVAYFYGWATQNSVSSPNVGNNLNWLSMQAPIICSCPLCLASPHTKRGLGSAGAHLSAA